MHPVAPTLRRMGRYALYDKIATGGMATLYLGRLVGPAGFARTVAVKCLHPQFAQDPDFSAMFLDEARLASRIRSPYVVPTLDVVSEEGELAIVMEYVHGESLGALVRPHSDTVADGRRDAAREVPVAVAVSILDDVLQGLQAAHEARSEQGTPLGIVHRDVSPQNILVGTDGLAQLIDFGVAKAAGRLQTTREGQLKGKLAYMAPEQLRGESVTCRCDLYAASVVLWETLVGQRLFRADDEGSTVTRVLMGEVVPPSKAVRRGRAAGDVQAIERLDAVVMRGLDRDPAKRFETAHDMAVAIVRCVPPAGSAEVAKWLEQAAGPALARRAAAIAAVEADHPNVSTDSGRMRDDDVGAPVEQPRDEASSISVTSGITKTPASGRRRRVSLWVAGGVLLSATIAAARIPWRGSPMPPSGVAIAPPIQASADPAPVDSSPAAYSDRAGTTTPPAMAFPPPTAAPATKRAPAATHPSDCNPPFMWDEQGKKHYKRQCL